jgi:NTP pyrophosphatase (non-canonical NTP hydrolase)
MDVKDFQDQIVRFLRMWDRERNVTTDEQAVFNHLIEEVGELARQYVNRHSRTGQYSEKLLENAIGDIMIQLVKLAHLRGLDVEKVVMKILDEEKKLFKK